jgi:hypothetical protein
MLLKFARSESKTVQFRISSTDFPVYDDNGNPVLLSDKCIISVGGGQPDTKLKTTNNTIQAVIKLF